MSTFEWSSSILGMLGFVLGIFNLVWIIRKQSPRLDVDVPVARIFKARLENKIGPHYPTETREVVVLELFIAVSNASQIGNTVVTIQSEQQYEIASFDEKDGLIVGKRTQDLSHLYGGEKVHHTPIYFQPQAAISSKTPAFLAPGTRVEGSLTGEIKGGNALVAEAFDLVVIVKDTHGNTYKKQVRVNREEPIDKAKYPLGEGACPTTKVCSI